MARGSAAATLLKWRRIAALLVFAAALTPLLAAAERAGPDRVKSGTGFFVTRDGFLVTSAHVIAGCRSVSVWEPDGTERPAYVVGDDRRADVALLWADGMHPPDSAAVAAAPLRTGEEVFTLGFGVITTEPLRPVLVEGSLIGPGTAQRGTRIILVRARLHAGHSGGAVLAGDGSLVGMVIGRDERDAAFGVAIPRDEITALLASYGIVLPSRPSKSTAPDLLRAISVLVQCSPPIRPGTAAQR